MRKSDKQNKHGREGLRKNNGAGRNTIKNKGIRRHMVGQEEKRRTILLKVRGMEH